MGSFVEFLKNAKLKDLIKDGFKAILGRTAFSNYSDANNPLQAKKISLPAGLGWNSNYPVWNASDPSAGYVVYRPNGDVSFNSGLSVIDYVKIFHPDYLTWQVLYCDPNAGTNGTGTLASPFNALGSAQAAANLSAAPAVIMVKGGNSQIAYCARNFTNNGSVYPSVDVIWIAYGGRVAVTSYQQYTTWYPENNSTSIVGAITTNSFSGYIASVTSGSTTRGVLTVTSVTSGVICKGMTISGGSTAANTIILKQLTGTVGSTGTYVVSINQTIGSSGTPQAFTADGGCLTVSAILDSDILEIGAISRTSAISGCRVLGYVNASGGAGTYWVSYSTAVASTTMIFDDPAITRTYRAELNNVSCIVDLTTRTPEGYYPRFRVMTSKSACRKTPDSCYIDTTTSVGCIYINRADGQVPTIANTRVYLASDNLYLKGTTQTSCILMGQTKNDGFDLEGGASACLRVAFTGGSNGRTVDANGNVIDGTGSNPVKLIAAENCTFRYSGAYAGGGAVGNVAIEGLNGLAYFNNCDASYGATDCWNFHNALGANMYVLTVNVTGNLAGQIYGYVSCNGWTSHDAIISIDICGRYFNNRGVTMHSIGDTRQLWVAPRAIDSLGDIVNGGANQYGYNLKMEDRAIGWIYAPVISTHTRGRTHIRVEGTGKMYFSGTGDIHPNEAYVVNTATLGYWSM